MSRKREAPWWIGSGATDQCLFCSQSYGRGTERRCEACDRAICPICTHPDGLCPECRDAEG